uniref:Uncharacterized protein n=1 Tax=Rhizophora mucronata TaxID=61149 RepID=A0A2P2LMV4_RHIMU
MERDLRIQSHSSLSLNLFCFEFASCVARMFNNFTIMLVKCLKTYQHLLGGQVTSKNALPNETSKSSPNSDSQERWQYLQFPGNSLNILHTNGRKHIEKKHH